jgi:hypothetical protein
LILRAADGEKLSASIITLNVRGQKIVTTRATLCMDEEGPLARMFDKNLIMSPSNIVDGGYFIDDDPEAFKNILFFLSYNEVYFGNCHEAERTRIVANKLCPSMIKKINQWLKNQELFEQSDLVAIKRRSSSGELAWFLSRTADNRIIGSKAHGNQTIDQVIVQISEHQNRLVHTDLCYAWTGWGIGIYNYKTSKLIGEKIDEWGRHNYATNFAKILKLGLIENAIKIDAGRFYIFSFNERGV